MTARVRVFGRQLDGSLRRFGLDGRAQVVHFMATRTGKLAHCGVAPPATRDPRDANQARGLEMLTGPETGPGWELCATCVEKAAPKPDPAIWGPR